MKKKNTEVTLGLGRRLRQKASLGLGSAALILSAGSLCFAQTQSCPVSFSIDNTTELGSLQFSVDFSDAAVGGGFPGDGTACVVNQPGSAAENVDGDGATLVVGWADLSGFTGPDADFAVCDFLATDAVPADEDFAIVVDAADRPGADPADPFPTMSARVGSCSAVAAVCGNHIAEEGEECDDGNDVDGDGCSACQATGSCPEAPVSGCVSSVAGKSQIKIKDNVKDPTSNVKDSAGYSLKGGDAIDAVDFADPVEGDTTYSWCLYDAGVLVDGADTAPGGICDGKPCWKGSVAKGYQYKSKTTEAGGIAQIKLKGGVDGKSSVAIKAKAKNGNYSAPGLPLVGPVEAQFLVGDGAGLCTATVFTTATKNDAVKGQYQAKGP